MPKPFYALTTEGFSALLVQYPFTRSINAVDMHHTWRPRQRDYVGQRTIESMWRYHTQNLRWSDIAQHVTIAPDGSIWTGRNWNRPPASAKGHNGSSAAGPFMLEVIGDFDRGREVFEGAQKEAAMAVIRLVQQHFGLASTSLRFHNQMSPKSCPGTSLECSALMDELALLDIDQGHSNPCGNKSAELFDGGHIEISQITETMGAASRNLQLLDDPWDAELPEAHASEIDIEAMTELETPTEPSPPAARSGNARELKPAMLNVLRGHVINLREGQFSDEGEYTTDAEDLEMIFKERLSDAYQQASVKAEKLKLVFYAHGGLTSEKDGLQIAYHQINWWKANNIYPLFFVWETGLLETITQLIRSKKPASRGKGKRDIFDYTTDPVIERLCRSLGVKKIWSGMKFSAAQAHVKESGGAWQVARLLAGFLSDHPDTELHAVGHSAGSIFHSHFIPACIGQGVPGFKSLHLLAPAITVDHFTSRMSGLMGANPGVEYTTLFTMKKDWERADHTGQIYRKSLLYLVSQALEPRHKTAILGLEESLRKSVTIKKLFGLGQAPSKVGEIVWSKSRVVDGLDASRSTTHGGFDNDSSTMHSVLRRVLDVGGDVEIVDFPTSATEKSTRALKAAHRGVRSYDDDDELDWLFDDDFDEGVDNFSNREEDKMNQNSTSGQSDPKPPTTPVQNKKKALCIGINAYQRDQDKLDGCVADAEKWRDIFESLGFGSINLLLDEEASREGILSSIRALINNAEPGDLLVIQYSGHGTQAIDYGGDESVEGQNMGQNDGMDEALCPCDYAWNGLIIDDDIREIFKGIPTGVSVTGFFDCCHSATISRAPMSNRVGVDASLQPGVKVRFLKLDDEAARVHQNMRKNAQSQRGRAMDKSDAEIKEVTFSACYAHEVALESEGQGHFTKHATAVITEGIEGMSNSEFLDRVIEKFGWNPAQHPTIDANHAAFGKTFLA